jgi:hypothetical protein
MSHHSDIFFYNFPCFSFGTECDRTLTSIQNQSINLYTLKQTEMAQMNVKPLADRVLVEPAAAEQKTAGGIIIPDTAKEKPRKELSLP